MKVCFVPCLQAKPRNWILILKEPASQSRSAIIHHVSLYPSDMLLAFYRGYFFSLLILLYVIFLELIGLLYILRYTYYDILQVKLN